MNNRDSAHKLHDARLLVLEDDPGHAEAIRRVFADAGWKSVEVVGTLGAFRQSQQLTQPDLVLADMILPDGEALELLSLPADSQSYPIVVMTSHGDEQKAVQVLKAGAFDYVVKSAESFEQMPYIMARIQREWVLLQENKRSVIERDNLMEQLAQAQKMEAIGQLTGGIAHDFNNILSSIVGYTDLALLMTVVNSEPKLKEYLTQIMGASLRARDLVANMLVFSRISKPGGNTVKSDAGKTVAELAKLIRPVIPSSIQLEIDIAPGLPLIACNSTRLHQAMMNLCINARDVVNEHGLIQISVKLLDNSSGNCSSCGLHVHGQWLELSVRDNGLGMDKTTLKRIFDPFYTTKKIGYGSGLGLSMVHGFVHESSGHIQVESHLGKGTIMRLLLPALPETGLPALHTQVEHNFIRGKGQRIMVVDDESVLSLMLGEILVTFGYEPVVFSDSHAALQYFLVDPARIDAVITDYTMPGMTGVELAKKVLSTRPGLPIVLCTGFTDKINAESAKKLGILKFMHKPVDIDAILKSLAEILLTQDIN